MNKKTIKDYFTLKEMVCPHVLRNYKEEQIWSFFDPRLLDVLLFIRENLDKGICINTNGMFERGLRCNCCETTQKKTQQNKTYLSAHIRGTGVDLSVPGMTAEEVRRFIAAQKLPHKIRLESDVTWVHIDVDNYTNSPIQYFKG